jgi:GTP cyclohydrolase II
MLFPVHFSVDYILKKEGDRRLFQESLDAYELEWKAKAKIKCQLAEIRARVYVEAVIGAPINTIEGVIKEKVLANNPDEIIIIQDSPAGIKRARVFSD